MDERRSIERDQASFFSEVSCPTTGRLVGHISDISQSGMMIIGKVKLDFDATLPLQIELPRHGGPRASVEIEARVCWRRPELEPDLFATGLEILRVVDGHYTVEHLCRALTSLV
jgi:hypothetical protein